MLPNHAGREQAAGSSRSADVRFEGFNVAAKISNNCFPNMARPAPQAPRKGVQQRTFRTQGHSDKRKKKMRRPSGVANRILTRKNATLRQKGCNAFVPRVKNCMPRTNPIHTCQQPNYRVQQFSKLRTHFRQIGPTNCTARRGKTSKRSHSGIQTNLYTRKCFDRTNSLSEQKKVSPAVCTWKLASVVGRFEPKGDSKQPNNCGSTMIPRLALRQRP